jgi:hypothetical protein
VSVHKGNKTYTRRVHPAFNGDWSGKFLAACVVSLVVGAVGFWPFAVWHGSTAWTVEVAWLGLLALLVSRVMRSRKTRSASPQPQAPVVPAPQPKAAPGPRDWAPNRPTV